MTKAYRTRDHHRNKWMRKQLINAAGGRCKGCGEAVNLLHNHPKQATIDHVVPLALGGQHILGNMQLLCSTCNGLKGATPPEFWFSFDSA